MSTIQAASLQNTGSGAPVIRNSSGTEVGQLCKAWVNFNGNSSADIRSDFNVTSVEDVGNGYYQVNFTNSMNDDKYCLNLSASDNASSPSVTTGYAYGTWKASALNIYAAGFCRFLIGYPANQTFYDQTFINVSIFAS